MRSHRETKNGRPLKLCRLKTLGPARSGHTFSIRTGQAQIGRAPDASWVLPYPTVSRYHARIEPCGSGWRIRDLGSTNGLEINGEKVLEKRLVHGDRIWFGEVAVEVEIQLAALAAPNAKATASEIRRLHDAVH